MTLSITTLYHNAECHYAEYCAYYAVMLSVVGIPGLACQYYTTVALIKSTKRSCLLRYEINYACKKFCRRIQKCLIFFSDFKFSISVSVLDS